MHPTGTYNHSKPLLADSPTDSCRNVLCNTSCSDNGLDLLISGETASVSGSLEGSDTTTPSSPPSVVYCVSSKFKNDGYELSNNKIATSEFSALPAINGKIVTFT